MLMLSQNAQTVPPGELVAFADQRVVLHGIPWNHFEAILALRGNAAGPRVTYLEGELELMSPSRNHESIKKLLARMIELYALERNVPLSAFGSWTLRNAPRERAIEPDECYMIGESQGKTAPDLALEVIWTSGGIDKLEVYRALGVNEVWLWRDHQISIYQLKDERYSKIPRSTLFPDLDICDLGHRAGRKDQHQVLLEFRANLTR